ncbi:MAG: hypothetical protein GF416_07630 [Candidatus Altiarchaeales archaeon]|nr:hypothetical protein [Candidatus Altiarchaeales archaeon]MBD3416982.1 hypothetical protein [Candidatus Altiarchaeales archaeon]
MRFAGFLVFLVLFSGCLYDWRGKEDSTFYGGIESAVVPERCAGDVDDVCALFECMVDQCWCHPVGPDGAILEGGSGEIKSEEEAEEAVRDYLSQGNEGLTVDYAVKLNPVFYNVFAEDEGGGEEVYTVAADGTIMVTTCGV